MQHAARTCSAESLYSFLYNTGQKQLQVNLIFIFLHLTAILRAVQRFVNKTI